MKFTLAFDPPGVKLTLLLLPLGVKFAVPFVGAPLGHATVPAGVKLTDPFVPAGVKLTAFSVGTDAGQATLPAGVKLAVALVPAAVTLWLCEPIAVPVNVSAGTVAFPADVETVSPPIRVAAAVPLLLVVNFVPVIGSDAVPFVPAGVPALTAVVLTAEPVNVSPGTVPAVPVNAGTLEGQLIVCAGTLPCVPVNASAGTVPGVPANVGVAPGHEIVSAGTVPVVPVNVSPGTVPGLPVNRSAGTVPGLPVNVGPLLVPAGV